MALDLVARLRLQDDLSGRMRKASRSMEGMEKRTRGLTSGMSKLGGVMAGLGATVSMAAIGKDVVQTGVEFTSTMSKVQAVSGATGEEMKKLTAQARELGKTTIHSASAAADAQAFLGQAGFKTNDILATMPGLLDLATAGQLDLGRAADIASNVMTGFNLKATDMGRIADVLAQSAANANTDVGQMGMAMSYIAPIASAMGVSLEEVAAGVGMLSDAGIQGERAGTALRGVIGALGDPTKALTKKLKAAGMSMDDVNPKMNSIADIIENLTKHGYTAADAIELVGLNAGPGLAALMTAGADELRSFTKDMENAEGAAKSMADIISDNLGADIELFKSAKIETSLQIFDKFGGKLRSIVQASTKAVEKIPAIIDKVSAFGTAFKPILAPVGKALLVFAGAIVAVGAVAGTISAIGLALGFLASPLGLIALAITGVVLGFQAFYKHSETFRGAIEGVVGAVKGFMSAMDGEYKNAHDIMEKAGLSPEAASSVMRFARGVKDAVADVQGAFVALSTMSPVDIAKALGLSDETIAQITGTIDTVKESFSSIGDTFTGFYEAVQPGIASLLEAFSGFGGAVSSVFTALMSILQPIFSGLATIFHVLADAAQMVFNNVIVPAVTHAISIFQLLWKIVGPLLGFLGAAIEVAFAVLKVVWDNILSPFVGFMTGAFRTALEGATPIIGAVGAAFDKIGGFISTVTGYVRDFASAISNVKIPDWVGNIGGKLKGAAGAVSSFMGLGGAKSHYHGLDRVPYDGYMARLHKGETVLTRQEADAYEGIEYKPASYGNSYDNRSYDYTTVEKSEGSGGGSTFKLDKLADQIVIREDADIDRIEDMLYRRWSGAVAGGAN